MEENTRLIAYEFVLTHYRMIFADSVELRRLNRGSFLINKQTNLVALHCQQLNESSNSLAGLLKPNKIWHQSSFLISFPNSPPPYPAHQMHSFCSPRICLLGLRLTHAHVLFPLSGTLFLPAFYVPSFNTQYWMPHTLWSGPLNSQFHLLGSHNI